MENICLIMIHCDTNPNELEAKARELYSPVVDTCYVRISKRLNLLQRAYVLRKFRNVFTRVHWDVKSVSDYAIRLLNTFICWHQNLAADVAHQLNVFGYVLYRLWQRRRQILS